MSNPNLSAYKTFKKARCRYFDPKTGQPISPGCSKGEQCGFLHPGDRTWFNIGKNKDVLATPLASQSDMFRVKQEEVYSSGRDRDGRNSSQGYDVDRGRRRQSRSRSSSRGRSPYTAIKREPRSWSIPRASTQDEKAISKGTVARGIGIKPGARTESLKPHDLDVKGEVFGKPDTQSSEHISKIFLHIARLSRESDRLSDMLKSEESKIETYQAIGATLKKISSQMETAVEPQLSQSALIQEDCKKNIEKNDEMIRQYWKDAVQAFVGDVTAAVDSHVRVALSSIRNEAASATSGPSGGNKKRNWDYDSPIPVHFGPARGRHSLESRGDASFGEVFGEVEEGSSRGGKRRKLRASSPLSHDSPDQHGISDQVEMIKEMKRKIEKQSQALAELSRENDELRAGRRKAPLHRPLPTRIGWVA